MQALIEADIPVAAVISNRADAGGLAIAARHAVPTRVVEHKGFASRDAFDAALASTIDAFSPKLVALAGFMRILTPAFVNRYAGRLMNVHPSLLPAFTGLDTHQRALEAGVKLHGCTVHFVTAELDHGPIIAQAAVPVIGDDTPDSLAARVLREERRIYPQAVRGFLEGRLTVHGNRVEIAGA